MELYKGKQRIIRAKHSGDIIFNSNVGNVTDFEDVPNFADWTEQLADGSTDSGGRQVSNFPSPNKFFGTNAGLLGAKDGNITSRGNNTLTTRTRRKIVYLE